MQIVLLRHGKPKIRTDLWLSAAELEGWIADYDAADIDMSYPPPEHALAQVKQCSFSVCSDLLRSRQSASALGIERIDVCDAMFRELDMPYARWRSPRLSLLMWTGIFRLMWLLGYTAQGESIRTGRDRARRCAERLVAMAAEHGSVVFVGHGALIWFIARRLKTMGWSGRGKTPRHYWSYAAYTR